MVRRKTRLLSLLEKIDEAPDDIDSGWQMPNRKVHKDELQKICRIIGIDEDGTVPEIRHRLRLVTLGRQSNKKPESDFNSSELFRISREIDNAHRLKAHEVEIYDEVADWGSRILIDGTEYEVVEKNKGQWKDQYQADPPYDTYEMYVLASHHFEDRRRRRLMVLNGFNRNNCQYDSSVVLEEPRDYGPYKRWRKDKYVHEVEVAE